ncbi:peptidase [Bacteroidia bacterium]|nr:peptidase [Bacteroidia bacterium]GHU67991.1 peptidase [Bacteroidia bacterium]
MRKILFIIILLFTAGSLAAQSPTTKNLEKKRKDLLSEIEKNSQLIIENNQSIRLSLSQLDLVLQQIKIRKELLSVLEQEINLIDNQIRLKEREIQKSEQLLHTKKEQYATAIRQLYKQKNKFDPRLFVLSAANLSQSFRRMLYLKEYSQGQRKQAGEIFAQQEQLNEEKAALLTVKNEKQSMSDLKRKEENQLQLEEKKQQTQVDYLRQNSKKLKAEVEQQKKQAYALDKEIERIIRAEIAKSQKAAKQDTKTERKSETKGGFALTKEEHSLSANFGANKGKLPFPLKGNYHIIARSGQHQYGKTNSSGIKIQTTEGNTARAIFDGVVSDISFVPQTQLLSIVLRHGSYITFYANLSQVFVKKGDTVKTNQDIGRIYTDGNATILHFEIWKEITRLNPESWLQK